MRILDLRYSFYFKLIEGSDSTIRHYSLFIIHYSFPEVSHERVRNLVYMTT